MKKRVLFLSDSLGCGGSEQSLVSLLTTLDYSKIDVDLWLCSRGGVFETYLPKEVNIVDFDPKVTSKIRYRFAQTLYSVDLRWKAKKKHAAEMLWNRIGKYLSPMEKEYDVAISFQQGFPTFYLATKVKAMKKASRVNIDMLEAHYDQTFCSKFYDVMDSVIVISDALKEQMLNTNFVTDKRKLLTVYNVFSVEFIRKMACENVFTDKYDGLRIVTTGRLVQQKGYDLAVQAAEILKNKGINFRWYFVGEGEKREELETMIATKQLQDYVILLGMKSNPYPYMKHCDIYVQTSLFEGFGRTVTEAKILKCPIISTNFPSVYDQIVDGVNGLIVEMKAESIAERILYLIENTQVKETLIKNLSKEEFLTSQTESKKIMDFILQ